MAEYPPLLRRFLPVFLECLLLLHLTEYIPSASAEGHCIWYGVCSKPSAAKQVNCFYNGTALPIQEESRHIIEKYCPDIAATGTSCCNTEQLKNFEASIGLAGNFLARCPSCWENFLQHICGMSCGIHQSDYLKPLKIEPFNETHNAIKEIDYHITNNYMHGTFNSCSNVQSPSTNQLAFDIMCGQWTSEYCTPQRWFDFMGDANGSFVPFQINYKGSDGPVDGLTPYDPEIRPCNVGTKASTIDGRRKGACLFCQEYFMDLYLLAELKTISLKVTTVDMQKPPPDFRTNFEATHPPILIDNGLAILENEKIERHIMKSVPGGHNLFVQDKEVASLIENLYSKLKLVLVRKDEQKSAALRAHLARIDALLERRGTRFLTGDTMCCFDCELMPRLQHIRVAGKYFVDFEIPTSFLALWRYMYHMYQLDAFTQSCPADQDIINHYKLQQLSAKGLVLSPTLTRQKKEDSNTALKMKKHEELETPTFTTSIPVDVSEVPSTE